MTAPAGYDPARESAPRSCGGCTMCCKTMRIVELAKEPGTWCPYCAIGKGCTIYPERPQSCRDFACLWLQGAIPLELKPDAVRAVVTSWPEYQGIVIHLEADRYDQIHRGPLGRWIDGLVHQGLPIALTCGDARKIIAPADFEV